MCPMVITNVSDDSPLMTEEIFGPITCIVPFKTEEEVRRYIFHQICSVCVSSFIR